jgi:HSP20 family molecular chaperone IbpA
MSIQRRKSIIDEFIERTLSLNPYELLKNMEMEMDRFIHGHSHYIWFPEWHPTTLHLSTEIIETEDEIVVVMEIPHIDKDNIDIGITEKYLEIEIREGENIHYRKIDLPKDIVETETSAKLEEGFLRIVVPKRKPHKKHRVVVQ